MALVDVWKNSFRRLLRGGQFEVFPLSVGLSLGMFPGSSAWGLPMDLCPYPQQQKAGPWVGQHWGNPLVRKEHLLIYYFLLLFSKHRICKINTIDQFLMTTWMLCKMWWRIILLLFILFIILLYPISQQTCKCYSRPQGSLVCWHDSRRIAWSRPSWLCTGEQGMKWSKSYPPRHGGPKKLKEHLSAVDGMKCKRT